MSFWNNPDWVNVDFLEKSYDEFSDHEILKVAERLKRRVSDKPLVTVAIPAYNEENNIMKCLDSLSRSETKYAFEVLVVNNNSSDRTQEVLDKVGVRSTFQKIQGWGAARQKGIDEACGKYVLTGDSDCIYPTHWIEMMTKKLILKNTSCVYGRFSYLGTSKTPRYKFWLYEKLADVMREIRHVKRPYLNCYGMTMGYSKSFAAEVKYTDRMIRGEDGRLAFDLMSYGKVRMVRSSKSRVFTYPRAIERFDGNLANAVQARFIKEFVRFGEYFTNKEAHDTKTSENSTHTIDENLEVLKKRLKLPNKQK